MKQSCKYILTTATGSLIAVMGEAKLKVQLAQEAFEQEFIVADIVDECLLRLDFMIANGYRATDVEVQRSQFSFESG
jgi:hypothetical protein